MSVHSSKHSTSAANSLQKQDVGTSVGLLRPEFKTVRELQEEVILVFYNSMLDMVVREWIHLDEEDAISEPPQEGKVAAEVKEKDFRELTQQDLTAHDITSVKGSKVSLGSKTKKSSSGILSRSKLARRSKSYSQRLLSKARIPSRLDETTSYSLDVSEISDQYDWLVETYPENVTILFKNGNVYTGPVERKRMHGYGTLVWSDGTTYEGDFQNGHITGRGKLLYKDCSYYLGEFCNGLLHGEGCMYVTTKNTLYSGQWKGGKKYEKGWLFYDSNNWYDGEWLNDQRHGNGTRKYFNGCMYDGEWRNGLIEGYGTMVWGNRDYYKGEWLKGTMHGYGEYIWKAFYNTTFSFPHLNRYEGSWVEGMRTGQGVLDFGFCGGAKMNGFWINNMKHGPAIVTCGNGKTMAGQPLFLYDKPIEPGIWYGDNGGRKQSLIDKQLSFLTTKGNSTGSTEIKSHESVSLSDFPKVMSSHVNPLCIPVHYEPKQVDLRYFIGLFAKKYDLIGGSDYLDETTHYTLLNEEEKLRNIIIANNLALKHIYFQYAFIATKETPKFRPVMIRLFLWQLYYDIDINTRGISLIESDLLLTENPNCGLETDHDPFERIYLWQFLQSIVAISWKLYADVIGIDLVEGTLAKILKKFIFDDLLPNVGKNKGTALCEYKDLLPIQSVYMLYRGIGDPPTARKLYQSCISKGPTFCAEKILEGDKINYLKMGSNATPAGSTVMFLSHNDEIFTKLEDPIPYPFKHEKVVLKNLHIFSRMKRRKIIDCIAEICPPIMKNGVIVNMEYPVSFLEFYNIILLLTYTKIEDILNYGKIKEEAKLAKETVVVEPGKEKKDKKEKKKK